MLLPPAVEVLMRKKNNIFLDTELIFKWPKRDFISTPKLFPLGDVHLGAGALRAARMLSQPAGCGAVGSGCVSRAGMNFTPREKNPDLFRGQGEVRIPPKSLQRQNSKWYPDLALARRTKGG